MCSAGELRDAGIEAVAARNRAWLEASLTYIGTMSPGEEVTGEMVRARVEEAVGKPNHHNAWGALIRSAVTRGMLVNTQRYQKMARPSSHARVNPVYVTA